MGKRTPVVLGASCVALIGGLAASLPGFAAQGVEPAGRELAGVSQQAPVAVVRASISGVVSGTAGRAVVGYTVEAFTPDGNFVADATTDSGGRYLLESLPAGPYRLRVSGPDQGEAPWAMRWVGGATTMLKARVVNLGSRPLTANLRLLPAATLTGQVTGVPVDSEVRVCGPAFLDCLVSTTDGDGRFEVRGLAAGTNSIVVRPPNGVDLAFPEQPPRPGVVLRANQVTNVALDATTQAAPVVTIRGRVINQGSPPPPPPDLAAPQVVSATLTDERGKRYVLVDAKDDQGGSGLVAVQVRVGANELAPIRFTNLPISAPGDEEVAVRVRDEAGNYSAWVVAK